MASTFHSHSSHWGVYHAEVDKGNVVIHPYQNDPDPSPLLQNIPDSLHHQSRIDQPMIRSSWLEKGPHSNERRGSETFVPVSWETAIQLLSEELSRIYQNYGGEAVYGGSYGWASAGRFHHAQSQLRRFLNCLGGFVHSVNSYSTGALTVIMPHVLGSARGCLDRAMDWSVIEKHTDLFVCFGGIPLKNTAVSPGGASKHPIRDHLNAAKENGAEFVLLSPLRDDLSELVDAEWLAVVPGSDMAVMLALAYTLVEEGLHDRQFLDQYCVGFERFERYIRGNEDGCPKTPEWAEQISGISAATIRQLARRMSKKRTLINVSWSLQRIEHGEQLPWMTVTLAAMIGQIGLPGGGFGQGYGSLGYIGRPPLHIGPPSLPQGKNAVKDFIPVARVADMLLHPGELFDYNGQRLTYPQIRLVYWCGGNPFHHHQNIGRLRRALSVPETIVVHDSYWTPMAKHADIVLPATVTLERNDIGGSPNDTSVVAMQSALDPFGQSRNDFDIFSDLSIALGIEKVFTEGRNEMAWLRHLYEGWRMKLREHNRPAIPPFEEFWTEGIIELNDTENNLVLLAGFRANPEKERLTTPSGRIEIFSETIANFGYEDCPGHPTWFEPAEWLGSPSAQHFPLHLIANNPKTRLHSQLDMGAFSQAEKVQGREPIRIHSIDAEQRGIRNGDIVKVFNNRGSCLAGAVVSEDLRPGVVQLSTGAWYDPLDPDDVDAMCVHGNPNVLTADRGTSKLAQGCSGQHALVEVERWTKTVPPIHAYDPPSINPLQH